MATTSITLDRATIRQVWRELARERQGYKGTKRGRPRMDAPAQQPVSQVEIPQQQSL
jgi:hypothetical protein